MGGRCVSLKKKGEETNGLVGGGVSAGWKRDGDEEELEEEEENAREKGKMHSDWDLKGSNWIGFIVRWKRSIVLFLCVLRKVDLLEQKEPIEKFLLWLEDFERSVVYESFLRNQPRQGAYCNSDV